MRYFQFLSTMSTQIEVISTDFSIEVVFYLKNVEIFLIFKICSIFECFFSNHVRVYSSFSWKIEPKMQKKTHFPRKSRCLIDIKRFFHFLNQVHKAVFRIQII